MKVQLYLGLVCSFLGYITALPATDLTYSHVRQQTPVAPAAPPAVGSDAPVLYLQDPSLATQQPELEGIFIKPLDNIKSAPQDDSILLVRKSRKVQWEKGATAAVKPIDGELSNKNKKDVSLALTDEKSDKTVKTDESDDLAVEGEIDDSKATDEDDLDKSNSWGFGFYGGGPWGGWGGWGGPWGGPWGGWGGGWGGWGGWGGPWGGFGPWG